MMTSAFKFREFIPESKQGSIANVPRISGEEIGSFYEELTRHTANVNSATEATFKSPAAIRASKAPCTSTKSSSASLKSARPTQVSVGFLFQCAQNGDVAGLRHCFVEGVNIDSRDAYGWTALMCAASSGATSAVKFLLDHGADRGVFDKSGVTPLRLARIGNHLDILKLLLDTPMQSTTNTVKVKLEKADPVDVSDVKCEHYCKLCKVTIRGTTLENHFASTVHQFVGHKAHKFPCRAQYHIPESNVGFQIMVKEGWNRDDGLGPSGSGMKYPPKTILKRGRDGFGSSLKLKARITHFGPRDVNAVRYQKMSKAPAQTGISKRELLEKERTDKMKEIEFRRMWYTED